MAYNYSTVLLPDLMKNVEEDAKTELAPILGRTEIDAHVEGVLAAIHEVLYTMFAIGHILSPNQISERTKYLFEAKKDAACEPLQVTNDILAKHVPEKLPDETVIAVANWVKGKIMGLMYGRFFEKLRLDLVDFSNEADRPYHPWNLDSFKVGKLQTLRDFIRTTVAPANPEAWFRHNMCHGIHKEFMAAFDVGAHVKTPQQLYKNNGSPVKGTALNKFYDEIGRIPIIKNLDDQVGIKQFTEDGPPGLSQEALKDLIAANLKLVTTTTRPLLRRIAAFTSGHDVDDILQDGALGLMKGIDRFDVERGFKIATYAPWWIRQNAVREAEKNGRHIRIPSHMETPARNLFGLIMECNKLNGRDPSDTELAEALQLPEGKVRLIRRSYVKPLSIDEPGTEKGGKERLLDTLPGKSSTDAPVLDAVAARYLKEMFEEYLTPAEARILRMRYGVIGTETFENDSILNAEELTAIINDMGDSAGSFSIEHLDSELHVRINPETTDVHDFIDRVNVPIRDCKIVYRLGIPGCHRSAIYAEFTSRGLRKVVEMKDYSGKLQISVDPRKAEIFAQTKGIMGDLLKNCPDFEIYGHLILGTNDHEKVTDLEARIKAEFGDAETKAHIKHFLTIEVLGKLTLSDIGKTEGLTRERIRQIEIKGIRKIRHGLKKKLYKPTS